MLGKLAFFVFSAFETRTNVKVEIDVQNIVERILIRFSF